MTTVLTATAVKSAKPKSIDGILKDKRYSDGGGLYLLVKSTGNKLWRYNYSFQNKKYTLALGKYPSLSLKDARIKHTEAKNLIAQDINPVEKRREEKAINKSGNTFEYVANKWLKLKSSSLSKVTLNRHSNALKRDFYPIIGKQPIKDIHRLQIVKIVQAVQQRGALEPGHRLINLCSNVWRYALQIGEVEHNIIADISKNDVLKPFKKSSYPTITEPKRIGELLRAIDAYQGGITTKFALQFLPLVFVRSKNIRFAQWSEFNFETKEWTIPAEKMKARKEHIVPLTNQAIKILKEVRQYTSDAKYVFHSATSKIRTMSDSTLSKALKRLDFANEIVPHGFRAMFSTLAYESGKFRSEVIENLLAHQEQNQVKRAYNRAEYKSERMENRVKVKNGLLESHIF
ncbi:MAG: Integrase [uncultured Campylobacterales bacterium]|uniref:Integrase n=1 Tax=uncultured Campylobacterales bacterium TaxID=352960 RepID=A0A6S6TAA1_9BACT|nr:MAG: Integrase [uncultured Campylobacterales bacterium]